MDTITEEMENTVWKLLNKNRVAGEKDLESVVELMKEAHPDISYLTWCSYIQSKAGFTHNLLPFSPEPFIWVCKTLKSKLSPTSVLVSNSDGSEVEFLGNDSFIDYHFYNEKQKDLAVKYTSITPINEIDPEKKYDMIVSKLPIGPLMNKSDSANRIAEASLSHLSDNGIAVFTFMKSFIYARGKQWLVNLSTKGYYYNAILDMPINSYGSITHADAVIIIFSKKNAEQVFVAPLSDEAISGKILDNFLEGRTTENPKLGVYVGKDVFSYSEFNDLFKIANMNKTLSKSYNCQLVPISAVGHVERNDEIKETASTVYIHKFSNYRVRTSQKELGDKSRSYYRVICDEDKISPRFLAFFLNTEEGRKLRELYGEGWNLKSLTKTIIEDMKIPCPPKDTQLQILATYDQLESLRTEIDSFEAKLKKHPLSYETIRTDIKEINNQSDRFEQWMESLPYPLATILKRYNVENELRSKFDMLMFFFEAYSIFESTILGAAINKELLDCSSLKNIDLSRFKEASFGSWVVMDQTLSNLYMKMFNSSKDDFSRRAVYSCFKTEDEKLIRYICSSTTYTELGKACKLRNDWKGHSGINSDEKYMELIDTSLSYLDTIRKSIQDLYDRLRLIRPFTATFTNGQFNCEVEILTGSNPALKKDNIKTLCPLDTEKLYIQMLDTNEVLELPPFLILRNSPKDVNNACYFYNRIEKGNTRYVSYHYEKKAEDTEIGETAFETIKALLTVPE